MPAELAVIGARVRTLDPARPFADAVACQDGVVVAVGSEDVRRASDDDGRPTGELREWSAMNVVIDAIPAPSAGQHRAWHVEALRAQNAVGITAQHLMDGGPATADVLDGLEADGDLTQRVWLHQY